jgi:hypothetical protein
MFNMKCPDNFHFSTYRGKTVRFDAEWVSPWGDEGRPRKAWVVVDPVSGKNPGDLIPKICWSFLEEEMKRQTREMKAANKKPVKTETVERKLTKARPQNTDKFFNPFKM